MIKYKGNASKLLSDISLEFGNVVDLRTSEMVLKGFFEKILKNNSLDQDILVLSTLPCFLKPFCKKNRETKEIEHALFSPLTQIKTFERIFKILEKYISPYNIHILYSCIPANFFSQNQKAKKEIFLAA